MKPQRQTFLHLTVIAAIAVAAYANSFSVPFHFDDLSSIVENHLIRDWGLMFSPSQYCSTVAPQNIDYVTCQFFQRRFVGYLTFAINFSFNGLNVFGYHAVNLMIHIAAAFLVYLLTRLICETPVMKGKVPEKYYAPAAFFTALLFISHPLQTQAVTYIVQRFTSLSAFFYFLAVVLYIKARLLQEVPGKGKSRAKAYPRLALVSFGLAFLSTLFAMRTKEISFTLPLMIILTELSFFRGVLRKRILTLAPFALTLLIIPAELIGIGKPLHQIMEEVNFASRVKTEISRVDYLFTQFPVVAAYLRLLAFPVGQNLDYDSPVFRHFTDPAVLLSFLFLVGLIGLGVYCWNCSRNGKPLLRVVAFGIFWFFLSVSVESSLIPIVDIMFEHRVYLPSAGAFIALVFLLFSFVEKYENKVGNGFTKALPIFFYGFIILLTLLTIKRNFIWQDEVALWTDVTEKSPGKARGFSNLGYTYMKKGDYERAIPFLLKALELDPNYLIARNNLGNSFYQLGRYEEAVKEFSRAIETDPRYADIYNNRGNAYEKLGGYDKAVEDYSLAISMISNDPDYYYNRGYVYLKQKRYDRSIEDFSRTIQFNPGHAAAYLERGIVFYSGFGNMSRALEDFERSCVLGSRAACEILSSGLQPAGQAKRDR